MTKISIITICLNSGLDISRTIKSVLSQKYQNIEFIVIDGASSDISIDILMNHIEGIDYFISEPDKGIYDALNKGIKVASGDVIGILHSGDVFCDDSVIYDVAVAFEDHSATDILSGNALFFNFENGKIIRRYNSGFFKPWMLRFGFMPPHTGSFIKQHVFRSLNYYRSELISAGDFDFFVRFFQIGSFNFSSLNRNIVKMKMGGTSTSGIKSYVRTSRELLLSCKKNNLYTNLFFILLRLPIKGFLRLLS